MRLELLEPVCQRDEDAEIGFTIVNRTRGGAQRLHKHAKPNLRVLRRELGQRSRETRHRVERIDHQRYFRLDAPRQFIGGGPEHGRVLQQPLDSRQQQLTSLCQTGPIARAIEQVAAQLGFEFPDDVADRRLRRRCHDRRRSSQARRSDRWGRRWGCSDTARLGLGDCRTGSQDQRRRGQDPGRGPRARRCASRSPSQKS